jgi:hypothetical protein
MQLEIGQRHARSVSLASPARLDRRRLTNIMATGLVWLCALVAIGMLALILGHVALEGVGATEDLKNRAANT